VCLPFSACRSLSTSPPALWHSENIGFLTCARLWRTAAVRLRGVPFSSRRHRVPGSPVYRYPAEKRAKAEKPTSVAPPARLSGLLSIAVLCRPDGPADRPQTTAGRDTGVPITSVIRYYAFRARCESASSRQESRGVQPIQLVCESCVYTDRTGTTRRHEHHRFMPQVTIVHPHSKRRGVLRMAPVTRPLDLQPHLSEHARPDVIVKMERQTRPRMIAWSPTLTSTAAEAFQASAVGSSLP